MSDVIMPVKNLVPPGQCNGTQLLIISLPPNLIDIKILASYGEGDKVMIPRMHPLGSVLPAL